MDIDFDLLERIAKQRRFEARTLEIAKRLFIHGESPKRLSIEYGVNMQRVYAIRKEVLSAAEALALPPGWEEFTVRGPRDVIEKLRRQFELEMARVASDAETTRSTPST
jgi:hypothetical protein